MVRARGSHGSYCYCCRQHVDQHIGLLMWRGQRGWHRSFGLCRPCYVWLRDIMELVRQGGPREDEV